MSRIRSKNSVAEKLVFSFLESKNIYFQKHYSRVAGSPDVVLPRKRRAVFVDGDFWHGRNFNGKIRGRKAGDYWVEKIKENVKRDKRQRSVLRKSGWSVIRIWESDIIRKSTQNRQFMKIEKFLKKA